MRLVLGTPQACDLLYLGILEQILSKMQEAGGNPGSLPTSIHNSTYHIQVPGPRMPGCGQDLPNMAPRKSAAFALHYSSQVKGWRTWQLGGSFGKWGHGRLPFFFLLDPIYDAS